MKHEIKIVTNQKFRPMRAVWSCMTPIFVIGIGVALDSAAMQWVGFVFLMLLAVAIAATQLAKDDGLTIDQARKRLNEIEKGQL